MPLPDENAVVRLLREIGSAPTAPFHEELAAAAVIAELDRLAIAHRRDAHGNVFATLRRGEPRHRVAVTAHLDHPGIDVVEAHGTTGRARIRGGMFRETFRPPVALAIQRDGTVIRATASALVPGIELPNWSPGTLRLEAEHELRVGDWGGLDLPAFERDGDVIRMRAADDLAGCALVLGALERLRDDPRPCDVTAVFTRAEESGLFGARLVIEDGALPRETLVVSVEGSSAIAGVEVGGGPIVRVGDYNHTFDDTAESFLRVAAERLADEGVATQRRLMPGGTCEASAFLDAGHRVTGIAIPIRNYHNNGPDGPAPEILRLSDVRAGVALLAEGIVAAGEGAVERYRVDTGPVPDEIRRLLGSV